MEASDLPLWIAAAATLLKRNGALVLIHRPEALSHLLASLGPAFGAIALRPIHPRADKAATRLLVLARKGARAPLTIVPPLVLHEAEGTFTKIAAAIHQGEIELPFT
jgi:tRNA1(Val) A37 N6-methylase TrmN6